MGIQLQRKSETTDRRHVARVAHHHVILRGVASLPLKRISVEDREKFLTATPTRSKSAPGKAQSFPVFEIQGKRILIPKYTYFARFYKEDDEIEFVSIPEDAEKHAFLGLLYTDQTEGMVDILAALGTKRGATGKGRCGTGKTVIGTYLMARIKGKNAVLVDQTQIAEQWVQEMVTHVPSASISFIMPLTKQRKICKKYNLEIAGREKIDTSGDFVIAMAQTVMRTPQSLTIPLSLLIVDEAHSFSAPSFAKSIFRFSFKYSVALTATDERPDGLDWVFKNILGPTIVPLKGKRMDPIVVSVAAGLEKDIRITEHKMFWCPKYNKMRTFWSCRICTEMGQCRALNSVNFTKLKKVAYYEIWSRLSKDPLYNKTIIDVIRKLHKEGRHILVLAKYKDHLRFLKHSVIKCGVPESDTSLYFGGMDKDKCLPFPITFATFGIAYKALNAPDKDAEVLAMPVSNVEQPAGRVEREVAGKKRPIIVDFIIRGAPFLMGQYKKRRAFYEKAGYDHADNLTQALNLRGDI